MTGHVAIQLERVKDEISAAAVKVGRDPASVKLIAVSKTFPVEAIMAAYESGQRRFGENRIQELEAKIPLLPADIEWHLLGHLQSNKALKAVCLAHCIHSVDSSALQARLARLAAENNTYPKILLEINIAGEESKFGMRDETEIVRTAEMALGCGHLVLSGLMTMAPYGASVTELRTVFAGLRQLRDRLAARCGTPLPELSMGMSSDFTIAVEEGATMVRIGAAIFGKRKYHEQ